MDPLPHLMGAQFGQGVEQGVGQGGLPLLLQPEQEDREQGGHLGGDTQGSLTASGSLWRSASQ